MSEVEPRRKLKFEKDPCPIDELLKDFFQPCGRKLPNS